MPDDIEPGHSPVDDLKQFDWEDIDHELQEFLGTDSDSDTGSVTSNSSRASGRSNTSINGKVGADRKRKLNQTDEDDEDSDDASKLLKKQRIANTRSTGLKTVKTPNSASSESSLPTPAVTGDEAGEDGTVKSLAGDEEHDGLDQLEADLEADLMAEFAKEEAEAGDDV